MKQVVDDWMRNLSESYLGSYNGHYGRYNIFGRERADRALIGCDSQSKPSNN